MKLEFLFAPTSDLNASLALYRDGLGFSEVWREGGRPSPYRYRAPTCSSCSTPVPLMPRSARSSSSTMSTPSTQPVRGTLTVIEEISEIPGGFMATYQDPGGVTIYVMDQSTDSAPQ